MFASAQQLEPNVSANEAAALADLDWPVLAQPIQMQHPETVPWVSDQYPALDMPDYRSIVKGVEPFDVFQVASDKYKPHQNLGKYDPDHKIGVIDTAFETAREVGLEPSRIGSLKSGGLIFIQCKMAEAPATVKDEKIDRYFTLVTSHDGSVRTKVGLTTVCIVCINTFMAASQSLDWGISHRSELNAEAVADMQRALSDMHAVFGKFLRNADRLSNASLADDKTALRLVDWITNTNRKTELVPPMQIRETPKGLSSRAQQAFDILYNTVPSDDEPIIHQDQLSRTGKGVLKEILYGPGADLDARRGNAWGIFNGVTRYADHAAPVRKNGDRGINAAQRSREYSGTFGGGGAMKREALANLLGYAELVEKEVLV